MWAAFSARSVIRALAALALLLGLAGPAAAQPGKRIKVTVVVILASERSSWVDPRLKCIAEEVRKLDPSLRGFRLVTMACQSLTVDQRTAIAVVEGTTAEVVVHCCGDKNNRVTLAVTPPGHGEIVYRTVCGKFLPIVTRYRTREHIPPFVVVQALGATRASLGCGLPLAAALLVEGRTRDRLILAIRVQPCKGR
jgi:hypothetical protein